MIEEVANRLALLRQELHQFPELSGKEGNTAMRIATFFEPLRPDETLTHLGGYGIAFIFNGLEKGLTTLIRCELDALPIAENSLIAHKSRFPGKSHACGHDGHMAIVCGVGEALAQDRPKKGRVVLLFQPAEETGEGAKAVINSKLFPKLKPDFAFALHNLPGYAKNEIVLKKGPFAAASSGMEIHLIGRTSHAAHPEAGNSPSEAMSRIIIDLQKLPNALKGFSQITVVNAVLGEVAFGTTPGKATVRATLRTFEDYEMKELIHASEDLVKQIASEYGLEVNFNYRESFNTTENHSEPWEFTFKAANKLNFKVQHLGEPIRWSEDFGQFSQMTKTMIFGLGSGLDHPQLHESHFDFPDEVIPTGVQMFLEIIRQINY